MKRVSLGLAIVLALFLVFMGLQKFTGPNPIFSYIAMTTGIGLFEPWVRMLTGAGEIIAALLLIVPKYRRFGALLALALIGGAIGFHLSPFLGVNAPVAFGPNGEYIRSVMLFYMALSSFAVALTVSWLTFRSKH